MSRHSEHPFSTDAVERPVGRWLLAVTGTVVAMLLASRMVETQLRLQRLEAERQTASIGLYHRILGVREEIMDIRADLDSTTHQAVAAVNLSERLRTAEARLGDIGRAVEAQSSSLTDLERERKALVPELEQRLDERDERLLRRWERLSELVSSTQELANESRRHIQDLDQALAPRDLRGMWRELVGPVVQLAGDTSVGSGVLLESKEDAAQGDYQTLLVTAWHVVRDIQGDLSKTDMPVPVNIYDEDGSIRHELAQLMYFDPELDTALLEIRSAEPLENGATLAPRRRLDQVRIFDSVYAVGCPLGNDPIPTHGEIATVDHEVDGEHYWMINAPTYIGNSGGGIFDSDTHELLGIFSKIYTHGTLRPTIVPHMGLVTPMSAIYDWLEQDEGYVLSASREDEVATVRSSARERE